MRWHWVLIQLTCTAALMLQLGSVLLGYIKPSQTYIHVETRDLNEKGFPIIFKICVRPGFNSSAFENAGYFYDGAAGYIYGVSKYNNSVLGWAGHTNTSSGVQNSVKSFHNLISMHNITDVIKWVRFYPPVGSDSIDINVQDHVFMKRMNFPDNCNTLDIFNNKDVQELGVKQLRIGFQHLKNFTVKINIEGRNLACNRVLNDHTFYSSGDLIRLNDKNTIKKRYFAVQIKENIYVEKDKSKKCRDYPNKYFPSYRS